MKKNINKIKILIGAISLVFVFTIIQTALAKSGYFNSDNNNGNNQEYSIKTTGERIKEPVHSSDKNIVKRQILEDNPITLPSTDNVLSNAKSESINDIKNITVEQDFQNNIEKSDAKNVSKNIKNLKLMIEKNNVPNEYMTQLNKLVVKGYKMNDILTAYDYLYENYGKVNEMEAMLKQKKSNNNWAKTFTEYIKDKKQFIPSKFKDGYLEALLATPGITPDDEMIADRLSQMGVDKFQNLIAMRIEGKTWKEIKTQFGIINTEEKQPRITISSNQVNKYAKDTKLTGEQIIEAIVLASKTSMTNDEVITQIKAGNKKEDIYSQYYSKKFN